MTNLNLSSSSSSSSDTSDDDNNTSTTSKQQRQGTKGMALTTAAAAVIAIASQCNPIETVAAATTTPCSTVSFLPKKSHPVHPTFVNRRSHCLKSSISVLRGGGNSNSKDGPSSSAAKNNKSTSRKKSDKASNNHKKKKKKSKNNGKSSQTHEKQQQSKKKKEKEEQEEPQSSFHQNSQSNKEQDDLIAEILSHENDYYAVLGISRTASAQDIKRAYRKRALQTHPDKLSNHKDARRVFDLVTQAHDVLGNPDQRAMYDRFGKEGLSQQQQGGPGGFSSHDLFRNFFGQAFPGASSPFGQQRGERGGSWNRTVRYQLEVSLEQLYHGMTETFAVEVGHEQTTQRMEVTVPPGSMDGEIIAVSNNDENSSSASKVEFMLAQRPHREYTRKGNDLALRLDISLSEALCGCRRTIRHLDGQDLIIESARQRQRRRQQPKPKIQSDDNDKNNDTNEIDDDDDDVPLLIQSGNVHVLKGRGMPIPGTANKYGDLYIQYQVQLPSSSRQFLSDDSANLTKEERCILRRLLTKLEGKPSPSSPSSSFKKTNEKDDTVKEEPDDTTSQDGEEDEKVEIHPLQLARPSDFGRGYDDRRRRRRQSSQFFFHSGPFGGPSQSSSFFGDSMGGNGEDGNENVQCQQM